ncbi:MAG: hypothetical protein L6254_03145 [Candidatus Omnitrophica bacterium]|nr:hypothetical protein [Candidatus Omnitrophota bacterium]
MNKYKIFLITILLSLLFSFNLWAQEYRLVAEELYSFGKAFFKEARYVEAKHEFEKCLLVNPGHVLAKRLLGLCEKKIAPEKKKIMLLVLEEAEKKIKPKLEARLKTTPRKQEPPRAPSQRVNWTLKQGTWQLKQGEFYGETYNKYYWHNKEFDGDGNKNSWAYNGEYYEIRTEYKLEYGLTDRYTLLLYPVFKRVNWKDDNQDITRTGYVEIWPGVQYLLFDKPFFGWLRGRVKFPANYREGADVTAALGTHQIDTELKLLTAQPWPELPGYTKFELGFKARNEEPANAILYFSQLGYNLRENLLLELTLDGQESLAQTGGINEDWIKYTVGPIIKVGLFNIKFGYGNTFAGKNTSAAEEVYLSAYTWW